MTTSILVYFTFQTKSAFIPFRSLYPECSLYIQGEPQLFQLACLRSPCHRGKGCMETLVKRVHYFFEEIEPSSEMLLAYFKVGDSLKAGVFFKDLREPELKTINPFGFKRFQREGDVKQWLIKEEFINIGSMYKTDTIISATKLIRGR